MRFYQRVVAGISLLFYSLFILAPKALAATSCPDGQANIEGIGCTPTDPAGFVNKFYGIGLGLIGGVAVLFVILGGYFILTSQGDAQKLATGRSYITYAVIGLLLAIFGFIFTTIIAVDILRIPGFN